MYRDLSVSGISELISVAGEIASDAEQRFGELSAAQINWKPGEDRWSIGQCVDHLIKSNQSYYPTFEKVIRREKKKTLWERIPVVPAVWGKILIKTLEPDSPNKLKAPPIFRPTSSSIDEYIVGQFLDEQDRLIRFMKETSVMEVDRIIISSPVSGLITYSLMDGYRIIVTHERRHILQARRVMEAGGFPR
jgi:hypothetical protein